MISRVEICGSIASGKTTLCRSITQGSKLPIFENFKSNPFYESFYKNPVSFAFETELTFLLQHYHEIKKSAPNTKFVCDYSFLLDMAYADVNLTGNRHQIFFEVINELQKEIGHPEIIIYLICSEDILLKRIIARKRKAEISISIDYLKALSTALNVRVKSISSKTKVITIKSDLVDFRSGIAGIPELIDL